MINSQAVLANFSKRFTHR